MKTRVLALLFAFAVASMAAIRPIRIDHTKVSADLANFPVLVAGTYTWARTVANGGDLTNANGYDLIFCSDLACTTKLDWERESWNGVTGTIAYWVRVPAVSHTSDTVFYVETGDSSIETDQSNPTGVWDANFKTVLHFNGVTLNCATGCGSSVGANPTGGTGYTSTTGRIAGAANSSATGDWLAFPAGTQTNTFTYEMWLLGDLGSGASGLVGPNVNGAQEFRVEHVAALTNRLQLLKTGVAVVGSSASSNLATSLVVWQHVAVTYDSATGSYAFYVDGANAGTGSSLVTWPAASLFLGRGDTTRAWFFDEVRISQTVRPPGWISTEFNNQSSPSTFYSVGSPLGGLRPVLIY